MKPIETWPDFDDQGNLPIGVYSATMNQIATHFGSRTDKRQRLSARLQTMYNLVAETGQMARFILYGSFVTVKPEPDDVDIFLVMAEGFDVSQVSGELARIFRHRIPAKQILHLLSRLRESNFDVKLVLDEAAFWFEQKPKDNYEGASIFWVRRRGINLAEEEQIIASWQITKTRKAYRGIVEIVESDVCDK